MQFGDILKQLRAEKGLTQIELAKICNLAPSCIAMLETNRNEPSGTTLKALCKGLNISADYLLGQEDDFGNKTMNNHTTYNKDEIEIINQYRTLNPTMKRMIKEMIKTASSAANTYTDRKES